VVALGLWSEKVSKPPESGWNVVNILNNRLNKKQLGGIMYFQSFVVVLLLPVMTYASSAFESLQSQFERAHSVSQEHLMFGHEWGCSGTMPAADGNFRLVQQWEKTFVFAESGGQYLNLGNSTGRYLEFNYSQDGELQSFHVDSTEEKLVLRRTADGHLIFGEFQRISFQRRQGQAEVSWQPHKFRICQILFPVEDEYWQWQPYH
tara:strand:- start:38286 stop:38900 length:615 start_codon:yes stop_codon:yes gene_type:complete